MRRWWMRWRGSARWGGSVSGLEQSFARLASGLLWTLAGGQLACDNPRPLANRSPARTSTEGGSMRSRTILLLIAVLHGAAMSAVAADWLQFRGPTGFGTSADKGLPDTWSSKSNLVWKTELPGP